MTINFNLHRKQRSKRHRQGALLLELVVCAGLLAAILLAITKMSVVQNRQQRAVEQEMVASHQLQNLMETYLANDWESISNEAPHELTLSEAAQKYFPGHKILVTVKAQNADLQEKRVEVKLQWSSHQGTTQQTKSLVSWTYGKSEATP